MSLMTKYKSFNVLIRTFSVRCALRNKASLLNISEESTNEKNERKIKKSSKSTHTTRKIQKYFEETGKLETLGQFPSNLSTKLHFIPPNGLYVACPKVAKSIANELIKNLPQNRVILEALPGNGLVTENLVKKTENRIILFEPESHFREKLVNLEVKHGKRIKIHQKDLQMINRWAYLDHIDGGERTSEFLDVIEPSEYRNDPVGRIYCSLCSPFFIKHFISSIVFQNSFILKGRFELYTCIHKMHWDVLTAPTGISGYFFYRAISVLFQLFFEYEELDNFNEGDFLPWLSKVKRKTRVTNEMKFVKIVPRRDLLDFVPVEKLTTLWYFVNQLFMSRSNRVIPQLERWIPGCGPRLIMNNLNRKPNVALPHYRTSFPPPMNAPCERLTLNEAFDNLTIFTETGELRPLEVLNLMHQFTNFSEYKNCPFEPSMESAILKIYSNTDEDGTHTDLMGEEPDSEEVKHGELEDYRN